MIHLEVNASQIYSLTQSISKAQLRHVAQTRNIDSATKQDDLSACVFTQFYVLTKNLHIKLDVYIYINMYKYIMLYISIYIYMYVNQSITISKSISG